MAEISYNQFKSYLADAFSPAPVYLIFGEEYLYKSIYSELVAAIIPKNQRDFSLEELDGSDDNAYDAIERVNTFSLDAGAKVIGFVDSNIFYSKADLDTLVQRVKTAVSDEKLSKGADLFVKLLSLMDISLESLGSDDRQRILDRDGDGDGSDPAWLETIISYCRDRHKGTAVVADAVTALTAAVEKGFAPGNHLIITAESVDKRRKLYKAIKEQGIVIDCSVPGRDTRADKARQDTALSETAGNVLAAAGKTLDPDAFAALRDLTGFNLRAFHTGLEKLAAFTGDRTRITAKDVAAVMKRTKKDPVYELTGALFDKNLPSALSLLENLLAGAEPMHPLQVVAAIINQVRKLLIIRDFIDNDRNRSWRPDIPYDGFRRQTLPAIEKYDAAIRDHLNQQEEMLSGCDTGEKKGKRKKPATDLLIGPNPSSPFPTFQNFKKAANFSRQELLDAMVALSTADRQLKSSGLDPRIILENLLIRIVRGDLQTDPPKN